MKICEVVQMINSISSAFKIFLTFNVYYFENFLTLCSSLNQEVNNNITNIVY